MTPASHGSATPAPPGPLSPAEQLSPADHFSPAELSAFQHQGYIVVSRLIPPALLNQVRAVTNRDLASRFGDVEYEADLHYPGAPESLDSEGGQTIRRLRQAVSRDPVFLQLVSRPGILHRLQQLLGPHIVMPLAHHNCIMTKQPRFSSDTGWHQDTRYWSFTTGDLVNIWIALGPENLHNGCLQVLPGTHSHAAPRERLDDALFLRTDLPENQPLLQTATPVCLEPGDVLFFHARCFHAATRNFSSQTKQSAVFTFRSLDNPPLPGSRSAAWPELLLS
jgi:phytanoyl-CoA hydroxylase